MNNKKYNLLLKLAEAYLADCEVRLSILSEEKGNEDQIAHWQATKDEIEKILIKVK